MKLTKKPIKKVTKKPVKKVTKKVSKKVSKNVSKILSKPRILKNLGLNAGNLPLIGATLGYAGYSAINTYKTITTKTSFSNKFKTEGDVTEFVFDPKEKGEWNGDGGLAQVFLKEYLMKKYQDTCTMANITFLVFNIMSNQIEVVEKKTKENGLTWRMLGGDPESKYIHLTYNNYHSTIIFNDIINNQCKDKNFIIIPINLRLTANNVHANILL